MIVEHDVNAVAIYRRERRAFVEMLRGVDGVGLQTPVAATPAWVVADVLAHLVGITADLNVGNFGDGDADAWTAAQVRARRGRSLEELGREWEAEAGRFEEGLDVFGYELASHYVGDLLHHVFDVHAALGRPCRPNADALIAGLDFYLDSFHSSLVEAGVGMVEVEVGGECIAVGTGVRGVALRAERFELFRALGGRRSRRQLESMDWSGDPSAIVDRMSRYGVPEHDVVEEVVS